MNVQSLPNIKYLFPMLQGQRSFQGLSDFKMWDSNTLDIILGYGGSFRKLSFYKII